MGFSFFIFFSLNPPLSLKKKKKPPTVTSQSSPGVDCLVYLTGIPNDASEQEVTNLVGSFGKINNVILLPCSEGEDGVKNGGQKVILCLHLKHIYVCVFVWTSFFVCCFYRHRRQFAWWNQKMRRHWPSPPPCPSESRKSLLLQPWYYPEHWWHPLL